MGCSLELISIHIRLFIIASGFFSMMAKIAVPDLDGSTTQGLQALPRPFTPQE